MIITGKNPLLYLFSLALTVHCSVLGLQAQIGGQSVYAFLKLDPTAYQASMSGPVISVLNTDLGTAFTNPALLSEQHHNHVALNYNNYFEDISYGLAAYSYTLDKDRERPITLGAQLFYLDYGEFEGYDPTGAYTGNFYASDLMLGFSASQSYRSRFRYGGSIKWIYSVLETYISNGFAFDLGGHYSDTSRNLSIGLTARNAGWQNVPYRTTERAALPFEVLLGVSKKLKHAPFRGTLLIHNMQQFDLTYDYTDPLMQRFDEFNNPIDDGYNLFQKLARHVNLGLEILLSDQFNVRASYNPMRRSELGTAIRKGVAGFAWGASFRTKKIIMEYGSAGFFPGYNSNVFTVNLLLDEFYRKS